MEKDGYIWSVPMLDGFSFSQATNASEVTLNEMEDSSGRSRRGRKMFTDSLSAAEWSFATYARPFLSAGSTNEAGTGSANRNTTAQVHAVEEALWVAMAGQNVYNRQASKFTHPATGGTISSFTVDDATDTDGGDRADATYTFNVGSGQNSTNITYTGSGVNAVLSVVVDTGVATCTFTEGGQKFLSGETVVVDGLGLGGDADSENMTITISAETMIQYTSAAASTTLSPDGTPSKVVGTAGAVPSYNNAGTASDKAVINFTDSNRASLGTFNLYFILSDRSAGRLIYKLENAVVNEASMDFDIDGIATINWSGMGSIISDEGASVPVATITEGTTATNNFIRNRLTTLTAAKYPTTALTIGAVASGVVQAVEGTRYKISVVGDTNWANIGAVGTPAVGLEFTANSTAATGTTGKAFKEAQYGLVLTGGNVTITNNISFLTPETLGTVNQPIGHVTGARSVSGSFTCYLNNDTDSSAELFEDLLGDTTTVTNNHRLVFSIGGITPNLPRVEMSMLDCHLELPSHSIDDVISLETTFHALPSNIDKTDELTVKYFGKDAV
jgi:hypothetical protein